AVYRADPPVAQAMKMTSQRTGNKSARAGDDDQVVLVQPALDDHFGVLFHERNLSLVAENRSVPIGRWCPHLRFSWLRMRITLSATSDQLPHHATYDFQPVLPGREGHSRTKDSTDYLKLAAYNNAAGREWRLTSTCCAPPSSTMPSRRDFVSRVRGDVV